jgi:uncharacterized membrane protein
LRLEVSREEKPFWKSKKWWAAIIGVAIPLILKEFGIFLTPDEVVAIITPITAYILGQGIADVGKLK